MRSRVCGSGARRSRSAAVSRDLPMPGSPDSKTHLPFTILCLLATVAAASRVLLPALRGLSVPSRALPRSDFRLKPVEAPSRLAQGPEMPFRSLGPRSLSSTNCPRAFGAFANHNAVRLGDALQRAPQGSDSRQQCPAPEPHQNRSGRRPRPFPSRCPHEFEGQRASWSRLPQRPTPAPRARLAQRRLRVLAGSRSSFNTRLPRYFATNPPKRRTVCSATRC